MGKDKVLQISKMRKYLSNMHKIVGAHFQCVNDYAKFVYKGMKTVGVTHYAKQTPSKYFGWKTCLSSTPPKLRKY